MLFKAPTGKFPLTKKIATIKTAFVTQRGLFEFNRMPLSLVNAPTTFQRAMDLVLSGLFYVIFLCHLDDAIVFGRDFNEHYNRLKG